MKHMVTDNEYSYRQSNIMSEKKKIASEKRDHLDDMN